MPLIPAAFMTAFDCSAAVRSTSAPSSQSVAAAICKAVHWSYALSQSLSTLSLYDLVYAYWILTACQELSQIDMILLAHSIMKCTGLQCRVMAFSIRLERTLSQFIRIELAVPIFIIRLEFMGGASASFDEFSLVDYTVQVQIHFVQLLTSLLHRSAFRSAERVVRS